MERTRGEFHALIAKSNSADLARLSNGTRWTRPKLLFHMLLGYLVTRNVIPLVRVVSRPPTLSSAGSRHCSVPARDPSTRQIGGLTGGRPSADATRHAQMVRPRRDVAAPAPGPREPRSPPALYGIPFTLGPLLRRLDEPRGRLSLPNSSPRPSQAAAHRQFRFADAVGSRPRAHAAERNHRARAQPTGTTERLGSWTPGRRGALRGRA
jgi:hypothetical protein